MNSEGIIRNELQHTILARYIRLIPVDYNKEGRVGLRLELYGCSYCEYKWTRDGWMDGWIFMATVLLCSSNT